MALLPVHPKQVHHHCVFCWTEIDTTPRNKVPVFDEQSFISASGDEEDDSSRGIFVKREVDEEVDPRQDDKETSDNLISRQLRVIFILRKVLEVPVERLAGYLGQWGSPEEWIRLCEDCGQEMDKAWTAYQQILGKIGEFAEIRREIVGKVKRSAFSNDRSGGDREEAVAVDVRSIANNQIYGSVTVSYSDNRPVTPLVPKREVDIEEFLLEQEREDKFNLDQEEESSWNVEDDDLSDNDDDNWHSAGAEDDGNNLSEPEQEASTICQLCGKNCLRKQGLLIHLSKIHKIREPVEQDKEKQWICKVGACKASFILKRSWRTHYRSVHGRESKQEIFAKQKQLKAVSATATSIPTYPIPKDGEYKCEVCGKSYSGHQGLALHRTRIHGLGIKKSKSGKYLCEVEGCGKELAFSQSWRAHRRWHMKQSHIILDTDDPKDTTTSTVDYQQSFELSEQEEDQGSQEEVLQFKCDVCGTGFTHSQGLAVHRTRKYGLGIRRSESGKYLCEVEGCGKELSCAQSWNAHRKWHERKSKKRRVVAVASVEDPNKSAKDVNRPVEERRLLASEDITEFKCSLCGKSYSNQQGLSLHRTKIHGLRLQANNGYGKFLCEVENCGQEFSYKQSWKAHMKKHFSKPQHKCEVCGREFYEAQSYRYHMGCHKRNSIPTSYSSGKKLPGRKRKIGLKCPMEIATSRQAHIAKPKLKRFRCGLCGQEFRKKSSLVYHEKSHEQQGSDGRIEFPCPEANCGKIYENVKSLWIHVRCHKNRPRFPCNICGKKFIFQSKLDRHLKNCHNSNNSELENLYAKVRIGDKWIYECKIERCGRKFAGKVAVQLHLKKHTSQANYKCAICGREFVSANNFQGHLEAHDRNTISREFHGVHGKQGPGRVVPEISDYKSITADAEDPTNKATTSTIGILEEEIISPIETDSEKDLNLKCPHCQKECHSRQGLQNHISRKHSGLKRLEQFTCPVEGCSKVYSRLQRTVFYNHVKSHKQARYRCAVCGKEFYWRAHLLSHKQMHNRLPLDTVKPRSYVCDLCGRGFTSASSLKWHKEESKAHQEYTTKLKCKFCEVEFEKRHECSLHELTHELSGDKVEAIATFQCNLCGKTFKKEGYLKGHIRFVHEKKFKVFCELCGKGLVCNRHLVLHKKQAHKIDEEVETFKCEVVGCKRVFYDKRNFKEHQTELHGNEDGGEESKKEPFFSCQQCGRAFWHVHQLKKHIRRTHDETRPRMRKRRSEINEGTSDLISSQYFQDL